MVDMTLHFKNLQSLSLSLWTTKVQMTVSISGILGTRVFTLNRRVSSATYGLLDIDFVGVCRL